MQVYQNCNVCVCVDEGVGERRAEKREAAAVRGTRRGASGVSAQGVEGVCVRVQMGERWREHAGGPRGSADASHAAEAGAGLPPAHREREGGWDSERKLLSDTTEMLVAMDGWIDRRTIG